MLINGRLRTGKVPVGFGGTPSSKCNVLLGLHSGCVLKSLVFNLLKNDLPLYVHNCHIFLLTNDCKIFESFHKSSLALGSIQGNTAFFEKN